MGDVKSYPAVSNTNNPEKEDDGFIAARMNSVKSGEIDCTHALQELDPNELETAQALTAFENRNLRVAPNHGFDSLGEFGGFRLQVSASDLSSALPINRKMFHGVSITDVHLPKDNASRGGLHGHAVALFTDFEQTRLKMRKFMQEVRDLSKSFEATLQCLPVYSGPAFQETKFGSENLYSTRVKDSQRWEADCPSSIGLYHAFVRRPGQHSREHRVFIACEGGLRRACDEYLNLSLDIAQTNTSAGDFCDSEETWWLRKACSRMRADIIAKCAHAFNLPIATHKDAHDFLGLRTLANVCTETLHHDVQRLRDGSFACFNGCVNPSAPRNGTLMSCAPSEGYMLFRGNARSNGAHSDFGSGFGSENKCGMFPSTTESCAQMQRDGRATERLLMRDAAQSSVFVHLDESKRKEGFYYKTDELFMRNLEKMNWSRDYGIVELLPIVVGCFY